MSDVFYCVEWDEDCDWDESYDMLRGPDGFECLLTEPEDRIWLRDGRPVIEKLNGQADTIATLTARLAAAEAKNERLQSACDTAGPSYEVAVYWRNECEQKDAELTALRGLLREACERDHKARMFLNGKDWHERTEAALEGKP